MWHLYLWILLFGDSSNGFQPLSIRVIRFHELKFSYDKNNGPYRLNKKKDALLAQSKSWDEDYDDEDSKGRPAPIDMRYTPPNIMRQHQNFLAIREAGGSAVTYDIYTRDPTTPTFWFCGKAASVTDVSPETAISRQWPLIEEHAVRLRPLELFPKRGLLEIWYAPGDSELDVAYNRPTLQFMPVTRPTQYDKEWMKTRTMQVGFQGEIYNQGEEGFRTFRNEDGTPMKAEIILPSEKRAPTDEEMAKISELMKGKDMQELFNSKQD